jgi:CheY-like chemotaxis protein
MTQDYSTYVLIVDDEEDIRVLIREVLEEEGYRVKEASDGFEAWGTLTTTATPAVIIIDHNMPYLDGPGLMARMVSEASTLPRVAVIYSTAAMHGARPYHIELDLARLLDALSASLLWKPFDVDDLLRAVAAAATYLAEHGEEDAGVYAWRE